MEYPGYSDKGKTCNQYGTVQESSHESMERTDKVPNMSDTFDPKDGIQGQRALNPEIIKKDDAMHYSMQDKSHDPKDGLQGENNS